MNISKILCPVDFFPASERAVSFAAGLAESYDAELKLLHVVSSFVSPYYDVPINTTAVTASIEEGSRRRLDKLLGKLKLSEASVKTDVKSGDVFDRIEEAIRTYKPDLVAMGTHGRRGAERWIIGSITERLLRRCPVPVLTISSSWKRRADPRPRHILVTTDFSKGTAAALEYAYSIAKENHAHVTLLNVLEENRALISVDYRKRLARTVQRKLQNLVPQDASRWCETRVEAGTPYHVILGMVKKGKFDLIVMNIHGISMLDRALLGTTAERVLRAAECPVLLIPPMKDAARRTRPKRRAA